MQSTFGAIMLSLVDGRPQTLPLKDMLEQYVMHRKIVVRRRTEFELAEAERRAHILEGLKIALDHLDQVIALIRKSPDTDTARSGLLTPLSLSEIQRTRSSTCGSAAGRARARQDRGRYSRSSS
jgi:DNA gyrase subunit A